MSVSIPTINTCLSSTTNNAHSRQHWCYLVYSIWEILRLDLTWRSLFHCHRRWRYRIFLTNASALGLYPAYNRCTLWFMLFRKYNKLYNIKLDTAQCSIQQHGKKLELLQLFPTEWHKYGIKLYNLIAFILSQPNTIILSTNINYTVSQKKQDT